MKKHLERGKINIGKNLVNPFPPAKKVNIWEGFLAFERMGQMFNKLFTWNNLYKDMMLFSIGIFIKLFALHYYMGINEGFLTITIINFLVVIAFFCLATLLKERKRLTTFLTINIILSIIFFIDVLYYSHFFTLTPAHSIYQIGLLGPVSDSIIALLRPYYFLIFLDCLILWRYYRRSKREVDSHAFTLAKKQKLAFLLIFFVLIFTTGGTTYKTFKTTEGIYTPHNLGVVNYHLYDIVSLFAKSTLDDRVEAIAETITEEDSIYFKKGFGIAKGKNVIVIQAESLQSFVINKEIEGQMITPVLNELINNNSIYFSRFYEQVGWGNTSDAEFITHNSFYPSIKTFSYKAFEENDFITLPMLLKEKGYSTIAFHGNEPDFWNRRSIYPSQGIDTYISLEEFEADEWIGMGISDGSLFRQSIDYLHKTPNPFYAFYITLTSHHPFTLDEQYRGLNIQGPFKDTCLENYLQTIHYLDRQIGNFIQMLKREGLYEDTLIVIYGDHQGLDMRNEEVNELLSLFLGKEYKEDEMFRVPLIIHMDEDNWFEDLTPGGETTIAGGQIDFFPTIGNLLGLRIEPDKVLGKDLLNIEEGFVAMQIHVARGTFIDNEKIFIMSNDGVFENSRAWNIQTGVSVDLEECREGYERALAEVRLSDYIMQNNLISLVNEKGLEYIIYNRKE